MSTTAQADFRILQKKAEIQRLASFKAEAVWSMTADTGKASKWRRSVVVCQAQWRGQLQRRVYQRLRNNMAAAHAFSRMLMKRRKFLARREAQIQVAKWARWHALRHVYRQEKMSFLKIENLCYRYMMRSKLRQFIKALDEKCSAGDLKGVTELLTTELLPWNEDMPKEDRGKFWRLSDTKNEMAKYKNKMVMTHPLVCARENIMWAAPIQTAVRSGNIKLVEYLLTQGAVCDVRDALLETPLHVSCKGGDFGLKISKRIFKSCEHYDQDGETKWIIGMLALNKNDQTVLDVALAVDDADETVNWLIDQGAKATVDVVGMLEKYAEEQRAQELQRRKREEIQALAEQQEREKDVRYNFIMMDGKDGARDPAVRKIRKKKQQDAKTAQAWTMANGFHLQVKIIQAAYRNVFKKNKTANIAFGIERAREARRMQEQLRRREAQRKRREAKRKLAAEKRYAKEKKKAEENKAYESTTNAKFSAQLSLLDMATKQREENMKKITAQKNEEAKLEAKALGYHNTDFESALTSPSVSKSHTSQTEYDQASKTLVSEASSTKKAPPSKSNDAQPATVEEYHALMVKQLAKKQSQSPTLQDIHEDMREAIAAKREAAAKAKIHFQEQQQQQLQEEAARLAQQIEIVRAQRAVERSATLTEEQINGMRWYYIDLDGHKHGGYAAYQMSRWTKQGFFGGDMLCSSKAEGPFFKLRNLFPGGGAQAFITTPAIPDAY